MTKSNCHATRVNNSLGRARALAAAIARNHSSGFSTDAIDGVARVQRAARPR